MMKMLSSNSAAVAYAEPSPARNDRNPATINANGAARTESFAKVCFAAKATEKLRR